MDASCKGHVVKRKEESFPGNKKASTHCRPQKQLDRNTITFFIFLNQLPSYSEPSICQGRNGGVKTLLEGSYSLSPINKNTVHCCNAPGTEKGSVTFSLSWTPLISSRSTVILRLLGLHVLHGAQNSPLPQVPSLRVLPSWEKGGCIKLPFPKGLTSLGSCHRTSP